MSRGHQIVVVTGAISADPTIRALPRGGLVAELSIPITETYKAAGGERAEHTEWFEVKLFGSAAETAERYLRKGRIVTIEGRKHTERWEDEGRVRSKTFIYAGTRGLTLYGEQAHVQTRSEHQGRAVQRQAPPFPDDDRKPDDYAF